MLAPHSHAIHTITSSTPASRSPQRSCFGEEGVQLGDNMEAGRAPQPARPNQCQAVVASTGRRCSKGGMPDGYCATHSPDPNVRANMQLARRLGGARPRQQQLAMSSEWKADYSTPEATAATLETVSTALAQGKLTAAAGTAIVSAARAAIEAMQAKAEVDISKLMEQVRAIQEQHGRR